MSGSVGSDLKASEPTVSRVREAGSGRPPN